ncbi:MAG: 3-deoxy-manno-octulosonate cytidylyltransferase [bacterium]|nr:3-deoxy-manno-octulosonate cytidylyltransferase [bacterium]
MKIAAIIPSRYQSTRFEGKPLAMIHGISMIERVYRQVEKSGRFSDIIVATDDERIADTVGAFGGTAVFTSPRHNSGSERLWEVIENRDFDAAVNIQGDEPIVSPQLIAALADQLDTGQHDVVTPGYYNSSYDDYLSENVVKIVINNHFEALYFSRSPVPYVEKEHFEGFYHHIGMYGYLKEALERFIKLPPSKLEAMEKLEQLRFLDNGINIKVIISETMSVGVDVPEDIARVERLLKNEH